MSNLSPRIDRFFKQSRLYYVMKSIFDYIDPDMPIVDCADAQFFDDVASCLHDRTVYDFLKENVRDLHPSTITALLESLDGHDVSMIDRCTDWTELKVLKCRMLDARKERAARKSSHRLNYPIEEVLDDFLNRRTGKLVEAKRQLRKRFDGLDHPMQEKVMMALMEHGHERERNFIIDKLYGEDFWADEYIPLVRKWWEQYHDGRMARVVVKYCPREYILAHLEELDHHCNYATLCLRTGMSPDPERLPSWTYLFVLKTIGGQLRFREGEEVVFKWVRQYLYEENADSKPVHSIYDIPYVRRMLAYLGEMGRVEDIIAIDSFEKRMRAVPRPDWGTSVIRAIEDEFPFPPFVYKVVR